MSVGGSEIDGLPNALGDAANLAARMAGRRLAVFLDYDGTLTPIVDRPEDAVISETMREVVRGLARRCTVCLVSGRDRPVVQRLMGVEDLVVAGSHGFDIWSPEGRALEREEGAAFANLLGRVTDTLREDAASVRARSLSPRRARSPFTTASSPSGTGRGSRKRSYA